MKLGGAGQGFERGSVPVSRSLASGLDWKLGVVGSHLAELPDSGIPDVSPHISAETRDTTRCFLFPLPESFSLVFTVEGKPAGLLGPGSQLWGKQQSVCLLSPRR